MKAQDWIRCIPERQFRVLHSTYTVDSPAYSIEREIQAGLAVDEVRRGAMPTDGPDPWGWLRVISCDQLEGLKVFADSYMWNYDGLTEPFEERRLRDKIVREYHERSEALSEKGEE